MSLVMRNLLEIFDTFLFESLGSDLKVKLTQDVNLTDQNVDMKKLFSLLNNFIAALQKYRTELKNQIEEEMDVDIESMTDTDTAGTSGAHEGGIRDVIAIPNDVKTPSDPTTELSDSKAEAVNVERRDQGGGRDRMNSDIIQIHAPNSEIDRRIQAFIEQKRMEVDEHNRKEFCSTLYTETEDSCARVDSMFVSRVGGKSHIKVSRVVNLQGPQTQVLSRSSGPSEFKEETTDSDISSGLEERLKNMETHLRMKPGSSLNKGDVFNRLKNLEERILYLESLSPEYFHMPPPKRKKMERKQEKDYLQQEQEMSLSEIDRKMHELQEVLRNKAVDG